MIQKSQTGTNHRPRAALGRTVPRKSDNELLEDYADRMERGEAGTTSLSLG